MKKLIALGVIAIASMWIPTTVEAIHVLPCYQCDTAPPYNRAVNITDVSYTLGKVGTTPSSPGWDVRADLNRNAAVTLADVGINLEHVGENHIARVYRVILNQIYDQSNQPVIFKGVAKPSLEWSATGEHMAASDWDTMDSWNPDVARLSLNQRFWLNNTSGYQTTVATAVSNARSRGMDVILDLHWSDKAGTVSPAQQCMADTDSTTFWSQVANAYKSDEHVWFELYNEPHDVSWTIWKNGGTACGFTVVGMQSLYNTVRATGALNLVLIGGLEFGYDLRGVPDNKIVGSNIVYQTHPYDFDGKNTPEDWDEDFGFLTPTEPVISTEFGSFDCSTGFYEDVLPYYASHGIGYTGWAWYDGGCGFPSLITEWDGTPSAPGQLVKDDMQ